MAARKTSARTGIKWMDTPVSFGAEHSYLDEDGGRKESQFTGSPSRYGGGGQMFMAMRSSSTGGTWSRLFPMDDKWSFDGTKAGFRAKVEQFVREWEQGMRGSGGTQDARTGRWMFA